MFQFLCYELVFNLLFEAFALFVKVRFQMLQDLSSYV
jgi:hypothetical protein